MARQMIDPDSMDEFERQINGMIHTFFPHEHATRQRLWRPATDVYETDEGTIVKLEVAGMDSDDFTVTFINRTLVIRGVRQDVEEKHSVHRLEIPYGEFQLEVQLPDLYDVSKIAARYDRGFLYITLPKSRQEQRIPVRVQVKDD